MDEAIEQFARTAHEAVSHVAFANYREREVEAHQWITAAARELKAAIDKAKAASINATMAPAHTSAQ